MRVTVVALGEFRGNAHLKRKKDGILVVERPMRVAQNSAKKEVPKFIHMMS